MMTIKNSKSPEIRRQDLIDEAEKLFAQWGYESTAVSNIVKASGVAQGTFYYYFKSKQEIVKALIFQHIDRLEADMIKIWNKESEASVTAKLQMTLEEAFITNLKTLGLMKYIHDEKNLLLHEIFRKELIRRGCPLLRNLVLLGIEKREFKVKYVDETVNIIFQIVSNLFEQSLTNAAHENSELIVSKVTGFLLGLPDNVFRLERLKNT